MAAVPILMSCAWLMSFVFTLYFFYYAVYAVLSLRRGRSGAASRRPVSRW